MTPRKSRVIQPYTLNIAVSGLGSHDEPLKKTVLNKFFDEESYPNVLGRIYKAITTYYIDLRTNEDRKSAQRQRHDRHELIECLRELSIRLNLLYIPLPLLEAVRSIYGPHGPGKPTLNDEIRDLLLRLGHLTKIFERTPIPVRKRTNPGKRERNQLAKTLGEIFDEFSEGNYLPDPEADQDKLPQNLQLEKKRDKKQFVKLVFGVFHLKPPRL